MGVLLVSPVTAQETVTIDSKKPAAVKVLEIGKVPNKMFTRTMEGLWKTYDPETPLYIINYGSDKEIARREKLIVNSPVRLPHHRSRITLVRGGVGKGPNTVIWKVPYGADNPVP